MVKIRIIEKFPTLDSQCAKCKNLIDFCETTCKAFPICDGINGEGIPKEILDNKVIHNKVLDGQEGEYIYETKI